LRISENAKRKKFLSSFLRIIFYNGRFELIQLTFHIIITYILHLNRHEQILETIIYCRFFINGEIYDLVKTEIRHKMVNKCCLESIIRRKKNDKWHTQDTE
jgi:hypothetical protein